MNFLLHRDAAEDPKTNQMLLGQAALATNTAFSLNGSERNLLFRNDGAGFTDLAAVSGADSILDARSCGFADLDRDGDLDIVVRNLQRKLLQLFRNDHRGSNHRILLHLVGTRSNRDAIGARVRIECGGGRQMADVRSANGFESQSPNEVFFGLGPNETVSRIEITWPSGTVSHLEDLAADRFYVVDEDRGVVGNEAIDARAVARRLKPEPRGSTPRQKIYSEPRKLPAFEPLTLEGKPVPLADLLTPQTLVSFVTTWIPSFRDHMAFLSAVRERHPDLQVLVFLVEPDEGDLDQTVPEEFAGHPFRYAKCRYRMTRAWANQTNVLFPSSFLVRDGTIVLDLIGKMTMETAGAEFEKALEGKE